MDYSVVLIFLFVFVALFVIVPVLVLLFLIKSKPKARALEYGVASVTLRGEIVRSIGERRIADYFAKNNIRYVYEQEVRRRPVLYGKARDYSARSRVSVPDFYLPDYNVYVEYWGLVDAEDSWTRTRYEQNMRRKMAIYYRNNIKFISIYSSNLENLDWIFRTKFKKVTGLELPN
jgi:hypothetical protein